MKWSASSDLDLTVFICSFSAQIEVVADLPGVGENLHDHVAINENIFVRQEPGMSISSSDASPSNIIEYLMKGTGEYFDGVNC